MLTLLMAVQLAAAADVELPWQGRLTDVTGTPYQGEQTVRFTLYNGSSTVWTRAVADVPFSDGYANVELSGPSDASGNAPLDSSLFVDDLMLGVTIGEQEFSRQSLSMVPRAASVVGTVVLDDLDVACTPSRHGALRYRAGQFEGCTGLGWGPLAVPGSAQNPASDCKDLHEAAPNLPSGRYWIDPAATGAFEAYCDMVTADGGWTLLLTLAQTKAQYAGSVSAFTQNLNTTNPSPEAAYSRNWQGVMEPGPGSEILIVRATGDWVRFEQSSSFCGWNNRNPCNAAGSTNGHHKYSSGQLYTSSGAALPGYVRFNSCSGAGGCLNTGSDAPGVGVNPEWSNGPDGTYGAGWTGSDSVFYWGTTPVSGPATYWIR